MIICRDWNFILSKIYFFLLQHSQTINPHNGGWLQWTTNTLSFALVEPLDGNAIYSSIRWYLPLISLPTSLSPTFSLCPSKVFIRMSCLLMWPKYFDFSILFLPLALLSFQASTFAIYFHELCPNLLSSHTFSSFF